MSEWYLVVGFDSEDDLNRYKDEIKEWKKQDSLAGVSRKNLSGEELGVHLLDLRDMDDFELIDNDDIEMFPFYVFWKLETGFSVGHGFYDKKDMGEKQDV